MAFCAQSRRLVICFGVGMALVNRLPEVFASPQPLSSGDLERLDDGELLVYRHDVSLPEGDYFGGVSYLVIRAAVERVMAVLTDTSALGRVLPNTLEARVTAREGGDTRVFFRQGGRVAALGYSLWIRRESLGLLRFWVDPTEPHDIADGWGFFRVLPWAGGGSILTYAALLRLDAGLVKLLYTEKIRAVVLGTPILIRAEVRAWRLRDGSRATAREQHCSR